MRKFLKLLTATVFMFALVAGRAVADDKDKGKGGEGAEDQSDDNKSDDVRFRAALVRCGAPGSPSGCGFSLAATDSLQGGQVEVDKQGRIKIELDGAAADTTYRVYCGHWVIPEGFRFKFIGPSAFGSVGTLHTDKKGNFKGFLRSDDGPNFAFPGGLTVGQPSFAFDNLTTGTTQFTTGFQIQ